MNITIDKNDIVIDKDKVLRKWGPVLDSLGIEEPHVRLFACLFADIYDMTVPWQNTQSTIGNGDVSLLPANMKIISKLNLKNKEIYSIYDNQFIRQKKLNRILENEEITIDTEELKLKVEKSQIDNLEGFFDLRDDKLNINGQELFQRLESVLVEQLIIKINKQLENGNILIVDKFAKSLSIIYDEDKNIYMILKSAYKII